MHSSSSYHHCSSRRFFLSYSFFVISSVFYRSGSECLKLPGNVTVPAVFVFGDSIVDAGNNNYIKTLIKCNFSPYGRDFMNGRPTGRFSNGKVPPDFVVEALGIKELLPPYLDPNMGDEDLLTGVNFASGGAGFDNLTAHIVSALTMADQLKLFEEYKTRLRKAVGEVRTSTIVSQSIYLVVAGSDDIVNTYFGTLLRSLFYDIHSYTDLMVDSASTFFRELFKAGARSIGVIGVTPLGCIPLQRTLVGGKQKECATDRNVASTLFNSKLSHALDVLNRDLPEAMFAYIDVYQFFLNIINHPNDWGFEEAGKGCCGTGRVEVVFLCNDLAVTCHNASRYLFWDSYHPTEKAYHVLADHVIPQLINLLFSTNNSSLSSSVLV